jgi:hypothetical protein
MASKHGGATVFTHGGYGPHEVHLRGHEIGRVESPGPKVHHAFKRINGGYKMVGTFPTRRSAVDAVTKTYHPKEWKPTKTKIKRRGQTKIGRKARSLKSKING